MLGGSNIRRGGGGVGGAGVGGLSAYCSGFGGLSFLCL